MYIYEFLFRGNRDTQTNDTTWHVILAEDYELEEGEYHTKFWGPLNPEQAAIRGYSLSNILTELNGTTLNEVARLRSELQTVKDELSVVSEQKATTK